MNQAALTFEPAINLKPSWQTDTSHMVLSDIFSPEHSVVVWQRDDSFSQVKQLVSRYFASVFSDIGLGIREVFPVESLKEALAEVLPDVSDNDTTANDEGKKAAIDDIYLLSDMLTCLFNCDTVGLRLAPLSSAMCPSFHTDNIPVRLVCTYLGPGTQWLPQEAIRRRAVGAGKQDKADNSHSSMLYDEKHVQQMAMFDAGLLKGRAWENQEAMAAVHRSCALAADQQRVLLTLDPM